MSRRQTVDIRLVVNVVTIGALAGVAFVFVLAMIAHPPGLQRQVARASTELTELESRLQAPGDPFAYPAHALCRTNPNTAAPAMQARLAAVAGADGVTLSGLSATPGAADEAAGGIAPVALQFDASGRYDQVVGFMDALAKGAPEVFVDAVDLKSETSQVSLKFQGRIYCSPPVSL
jgi:hypothetical protein